MDTRIIGVENERVSDLAEGAGQIADVAKETGDEGGVRGTEV